MTLSAFTNFRIMNWCNSSSLFQHNYKLDHVCDGFESTVVVFRCQHYPILRPKNLFKLGDRGICLKEENADFTSRFTVRQTICMTNTYRKKNIYQKKEIHEHRNRIY